MGKGEGAYVFIRDPEYAWIPCTKTGGDAKKATVRVPQYKDEQSIVCDGGVSAKTYEEEEVLLKDYHKGLLPMQNVDGGGNLKCYPDMVELPFLHEVRCCFGFLRLETLFRCSGIRRRFSLCSWFRRLVFCTILSSVTKIVCHTLVPELLLSL